MKKGERMQKNSIYGVSRRIHATKPSRTVVMAGPGRPGRRSKGDRTHVTAKIPTGLVDAADQEAKRRGLDRTAILVEALADRFGMAIPFDVQEQLPLTAA